MKCGAHQRGPERNSKFSVCWANNEAEAKENAVTEVLASSRKSGSVSNQMNRIEVNWLKKYIKHEIGLPSGKFTLRDTLKSWGCWWGKMYF